MEGQAQQRAKVVYAPRDLERILEALRRLEPCPTEGVLVKTDEGTK